MSKYLRALVSQMRERLTPRLPARIAEQTKHQLKQGFRELEASSQQQLGEAITRRIFIPNLAISPKASPDSKFMPFSTCSAVDFFHPRFAEICELLKQAPVFHRKLWEWVFIIHKLHEAGVLTEGRRGIAFGVGRERLPALFASYGASILATDAPGAIGAAAGWSESNQHSDSLEQLRFKEIVADDVFDRNVSHRYCDMTAIDPELTGFDFVWSSCCFEHLGSLEAGMRFVIDSVEKTLKAGGVACHTTELNLTSDEDTLEGGHTVLYRKRDIQNLIGRLQERGHEVETLVVAPDSHFLDHYVDVPPYTHNPHLKLRLEQYVTTSVGIVVRKAI